MKTILLFVAVFLSLQPVYAQQFDVVAFGATPDSEVDASGAINRAIAAAAKGTGNEVRFPAGRFRLSDKIRIEHAHGLTVRGEPGTTLVMDAGEEIVVMGDCSDLTIRTLAFDRRQFAFTQGVITAVDPAAMTCAVHIDAGYDAPDAPHLAKAGFHPFVHPESGTYQQDRHISEVESWSRTGDGWQAHLKGHAARAEWLGKRFFLWAGGRGHCFVGRGLHNATFEDLRYWGGGGNAGFYLGPLSGTTTLRKVIIGVPPGSQRLFSCAGGGQIFGIRGKLLVEECEFTRIDDDGLDLLATWTRVVEQQGPRGLVLQDDKFFQAGDHIAIWDWTQKRSRTEAVITGLQQRTGRTVEVTLDRDVTIARAGAGDGQAFGTGPRDDGIDRVINLDAVGDGTIIRNCTFQVFRAKCLNLKARNCLVEGCHFRDCSQPALHAASEWYFQEGPPIRDLTIRNNTFVNCNHSNIEVGAGPSTGDNVERKAGPSRDSTNILIEGNTFTAYGAWPSVHPYWPIGNAIRVQNARGVTIRNNTFTPAANRPTPLDDVIFLDCDDVTSE